MKCLVCEAQTLARPSRSKTARGHEKPEAARLPVGHCGILLRTVVVMICLGHNGLRMRWWLDLLVNSLGLATSSGISLYDSRLV